MAWFTWGLSLIPIIYLFVFISLYAGCRIRAVPIGSLSRLAQASVLPLVFLAAYYVWIAMAWDALRFLSPGPEAILFPVPVFLAPLFGAPWFLRPAGGGGWGRAWGAAAIGGIVLCILICATIYAVGSATSMLAGARGESQATAQAAGLLRQYSLPYPADAKSSIPPLATAQQTLDMVRANPDYKGMAGDWTKRWPSNHMLTFMAPESPGILKNSLARSLDQAGFTVFHGDPNPDDAGSQGFVAGAKRGLFVVYECENCSIDGCKSNCYVQVWLDFAEKMRAVCESELAGR